MSKSLSIITCTGYRPEALALCQYFIERQTYSGVIQWVVVHDQKEPLKLETKRANLKIEVVKGPKVWTEDYNTHRGNMEAGLKKVTGDVIAVMEDDDYYKPDYLNRMVMLLRTGVAAVGLSQSRYYNVKIGAHKTMFNYRHASLSQTILDKSLLPALNKAVNSGELYFDIEFWKRIQQENHPNILVGNTSYSIGIKGMPGKPGITESHRVYRDYIIDSGAKVFNDWLGEKDSKLYTNYYKPKKETKNATNS